MFICATERVYSSRPCGGGGDTPLHALAFHFPTCWDARPCALDLNHGPERTRTQEYVGAGHMLRGGEEERREERRRREEGGYRGVEEKNGREKRKREMSVRRGKNGRREKEGTVEGSEEEEEGRRA